MKHVANKVERWALQLYVFRYQVVHISGDENVWADLLSSWGSPIQPRAIQGSIKAIFQAPHAPQFDDDFTWPRLAEIIDVQQQFLVTEDVTIPPDAERIAQPLIKNRHCAICIPATATDFQLRLCVIGHTGRGGHRGARTTYENISRHFYWPNMKSDITTFVNSCLRVNHRRILCASPDGPCHSCRQAKSGDSLRLLVHALQHGKVPVRSNC